VIVCPIFPGKRYEDWDLTDVAGIRLDQVRIIRDDVESRMRTLLEQYTSIAFTDRLLAAGVDPSVGSVGDADDNALAESTIGLYKTELINNYRPWRDCDHRRNRHP
jgi:transposase InsO family protein